MKYKNQFMQRAIKENQKQNKSNEKEQNLLLMRNMDNLKFFLSSFKESTDISLLSNDFTQDATYFTKESQIPDTWLKTRRPFNRNLIFYDFHQSKGSTVDKKPFYNDNRKYQGKAGPNYYPSTPLNLAEGSSLQTKEKESINEEISSNQECQKVFDGLTSKNWIVSFFHFGNILNYGPMNSQRIFFFLKNMYNKMQAEEKEKKSIMIVDVKYDVHYQPETLFQLLENEYESKAKVAKEVLERIEESTVKDVNGQEDNSPKTNYSSLNNKEEEEIGLDSQC